MAVQSLRLQVPLRLANSVRETLKPYSNGSKFRRKNEGSDQTNWIVGNQLDRRPPKQASWILAKQILRSSTAIGSNYRAACRAKSSPDFLNKLKIIEEETDETIYWLEILQESKLASTNRVSKLAAETSEVLAIVVSSIKTVRYAHN